MKATSSHRSILHCIARVVMWIVVGIVALVVAVPAILYIPPVQDFAKDKAIGMLRRSGLDVAVGRLRLKFPLRIALDDVAVVTAPGDTMVTARSASLAVKPLALLRLDLDVDAIELDHAFYQMGTADSAMWLRARVGKFTLDAVELGLRTHTIDVGTARLSGGRVMLTMRDTVTPASSGTASTAAPWRITARSLQLLDVAYTMTMPPTIDSLGCRIDKAELDSALVDMASKRIDASRLDVALAGATYLTPPAAQSDKSDESDKSENTPSGSSMWIITARRITLAGDSALYAVRGATPLPGLDMNYLRVTGVEIEVDSFYNCGTSITVPLRHLAAIERCGLKLNASGRFSMADSLMHASAFSLSTDHSALEFDAAMGMGDLAADPTLPLRLDLEGHLGLEDALLALPSLEPMLCGVPRGPLRARADINGTTGSLAVNDITLAIDRFVTARVDGKVKSPFDPDRIDGRVNLDIRAMGLNQLKRSLLDAHTAREVNLPPMQLKGTVDYSPAGADGKLTMAANAGRVGLDARWRRRAQGYAADLNVTRFPVDAFMPALGIGRVTAHLKANGHGYDFTSPSTAATVAARIDSIVYQGSRFGAVSLDVSLADGKADGTMRSTIPDADIDLHFKAALSDSAYSWHADGRVARLDLGAMKVTSSPMSGSLAMTTSGTTDPSMRHIDANLDLTALSLDLDGMQLSAPLIEMHLATTDSTVNATVENGDLYLQAAAQCGLDSLMASVTATTSILDTMMARRNADIIALQQALPLLSMVADIGTNNVVASLLADRKMSMSGASIAMRNDSLLSFNARATGFASGSTRIDTVDVSVLQHGHYLVYSATVNNRPGTMDAFAHVALNGFLAHDRLTALLRQTNIEGKQGFMLGLAATMADSLATVRFMPYTPTIGYRKWQLNSDNFVSYNFATRHIDANLELRSDRSFLQLLTEHVDNDSSGQARNAAEQEDIVLRVSNIELAEWLSVSPFSPPIQGSVNADMRFRWNASEITGSGTLGLDDLIYGRERVGSLDLGLDVTNTTAGVLRADVSLMVDSVKVITASGHLNDSTATNPFMLDFSMTRFPLAVLNPFLPTEYARLSGVLNGRMDVTGQMSAPQFNGYLDFDTTEVAVPMLGSVFRFSETAIPVDNNVVTFDNFALTAANDNPLRVYGTVDARHLSDIRIDLAMKASDMMVVNTSRPRGGADVYGKLLIDADAKVRGNMSLLDVDASLNVLNGTRVTYILQDASSLTSQSVGDMVRFVNFNDSTQTAAADSTSQAPMAMLLNAQLTISSGTTLEVVFDKGSASVQAEGDLNYVMTPFNEGRMTGRLAINGGNVRYSVKVASVDMNLDDGGYVSFTGDMMNPQFNIKASETVKANVIEGGSNSHVVDFLVTAHLSGSLEDVGLSFDMSTDNDITIQNELQTLSPEQMNTKAIIMLTAHQYTGQNMKSTGMLSNTALSVLTGQLNSLAAQYIKGVDVSFGVDQYANTTDGVTSTSTSYSYQVSKSLFDDRFKIVVGGNYSTDDNADENFSENLINDISFEYQLNRSGSMFVRLFRHTGYESILEGEVTQTGLGFAYRKKVRSLRDVFRFLTRWRNSMRHHSGDTPAPEPSMAWPPREPETPAPLRNVPVDTLSTPTPKPDPK